MKRGPPSAIQWVERTFPPSNVIAPVHSFVVNVSPAVRWRLANEAERTWLARYKNTFPLLQYVCRGEILFFNRAYREAAACLNGLKFWFPDDPDLNTAFFRDHDILGVSLTDLGLDHGGYLADMVACIGGFLSIKNTGTEPITNGRMVYIALPEPNDEQYQRFVLATCHRRQGALAQLGLARADAQPGEYFTVVLLIHKLT